MRYIVFQEAIGYNAFDDKERCPICNKPLRPDVVFFSERAPMYQVLYQEIKNCELLVVIGTSGNVVNTAMLQVNKIKNAILNILEPSSAMHEHIFTKVLYKPATQAIDEIRDDIETFLNEQI